MALPSSGPISTDDIMGPNGLNIGIQTLEWGALWSMASAGSIPKNKANSGGPYVLPNDWHGYTGVTGFAFSFSSGFTESTSICTKTAVGTLYAATSTIVNGTIMYTDIGLSTPFNGGSKYYRNLTNNEYMFIQSSGVTNTPQTCNNFGGTISLDIPGVGTNIAPDCPGCSVRSGYTLGSGITIRNSHSTQSIQFKNASPGTAPYPILVEQGPARLMQHTSVTGVYFLTTPADGDIIPPGSFASWLAFGKSSGSGIVILSLETLTNGGGRQQFFWTFNI